MIRNSHKKSHQDMKRKPFILLEILLAIALLSLCLTPIIGSPLRLFKKQKTQLIQLSQERFAPIVFYEILKTFKARHPKWNFSTRGKSKSEKRPLPVDFSFSVEGLKNPICPNHYHLYYHNTTPIEDLKLCILYCNICFQYDCPFSKSTDKERQVAFQLVIQKTNDSNV
jgi:hypothetical protein